MKLLILAVVVLVVFFDAAAADSLVYDSRFDTAVDVADGIAQSGANTIDITLIGDFVFGLPIVINNTVTISLTGSVLHGGDSMFVLDNDDAVLVFTNTHVAAGTGCSYLPVNKTVLVDVNITRCHDEIEYYNLCNTVDVDYNVCCVDTGECRLTQFPDDIICFCNTTVLPDPSVCNYSTSFDFECSASCMIVSWPTETCTNASRNISVCNTTTEQQETVVIVYEPQSCDTDYVVRVNHGLFEVSDSVFSGIRGSIADAAGGTITMTNVVVENVTTALPLLQGHVSILRNVSTDNHVLNLTGSVDIVNVTMIHSTVLLNNAQAFFTESDLINTPVTAADSVIQFINGRLHNSKINMVRGSLSATNTTVQYAGVTMTDVGDIALSNCTFSDIETGAVVYNDTSYPLTPYGLNNTMIITDCNFINCSNEYGGAIRATFIFNVTITNTNFVNNKATGDGHVWEDISSLPQGGGAISAVMFCLTMVNNQFVSNSANLAYGGAYYIIMIGTSLDYNSVYSNNTAKNGGAVFIGGRAYMEFMLPSHFFRYINITARNNSASENGGFMALNGRTEPGYITINDSLLQDNTAYNGSGGALFLAPRDRRAEGGFGTTKYMTAYNCTFLNNRALIGGKNGPHDRLSRDIFAVGCSHRLFSLAYQNIRSCMDQFDDYSLISIHDMLKSADAIRNGSSYDYDAHVSSHVVNSWPSMDELGANRTDWSDEVLLYDVIKNASFTFDNMLGSGGAVAAMSPAYDRYAIGVSFDHRGCTFMYNYASSMGGAIAGIGQVHGCGMYSANITRNVAFHSGGGIAMLARPRSSLYASLAMHRLYVSGNEAIFGHGGGAVLYHMTPNIADSFVVSYNAAHRGAGGVMFNFRDIMETVAFKPLIFTFYVPPNLPQSIIISNNYVITGAGGLSCSWSTKISLIGLSSFDVNYSSAEIHICGNKIRDQTYLAMREVDADLCLIEPDDGIPVNISQVDACSICEFGSYYSEGRTGCYDNCTANEHETVVVNPVYHRGYNACKWCDVVDCLSCDSNRSYCDRCRPGLYRSAQGFADLGGVCGRKCPETEWLIRDDLDELSYPICQSCPLGNGCLKCDMWTARCLSCGGGAWLNDTGCVDCGPSYYTGDDRVEFCYRCADRPYRHTLTTRSSSIASCVCHDPPLPQYVVQLTNRQYLSMIPFVLVNTTRNIDNVTYIGQENEAVIYPNIFNWTTTATDDGLRCACPAGTVLYRYASASASNPGAGCVICREGEARATVSRSESIKCRTCDAVSQFTEPNIYGGSERCWCKEGYALNPSKVVYKNSVLVDLASNLPMSVVNPEFVDVCIPCPTGAVCPGKDKLPYSSPGYYSSNPYTYIQCNPKEACLGNDECEEGYTGDVCDTCDVKYYEFEGICYPCGKTGQYALPFFVVVFTLGIMCTYIISYAPKSDSRYGTIRVALNFIQTTALYKDFSIPWSGAARDLFENLSLVNFDMDFIRPQCSLNSKVSYFLWFTVKVALPYAACFVAILIYLILCLHAFITVSCNGKRSKKNVEDDDQIHVERRTKHGWWQTIKTVPSVETRLFQWHAVIRTGTLLFVFGYLPVSTSVLQYFSCSKHGDEWRMDAQLNVKCYEGDWNTYLPFAVVLGLLTQTLGVPILLFIWMKKSKLQSSARLQTDTYNKFGFLYARYKPRYYWWELTVTLRKLLIASVVVYVAGSAGKYWILQGWVGFVTLAVFLISTAVFNPFIDRKLTRLEELSLFVNSTTIGLGILYSRAPDHPVITTAIIALIVLHILVLLVALSAEAGQRLVQRKATVAYYDKDQEMNEIVADMTFTTTPFDVDTHTIE